MFFKLVQGKTLDVATRSERLEYSLLRGCEDWEVWVNFHLSGSQRIATVTWGYSPGYTLTTTSPDGLISRGRSVAFRQDIVPAVKRELARVRGSLELYHSGGAPLIRVVPQCDT